MAVAALYLGAALLGGLIAVMLRLPPLVGFLAAGFVLGATGAPDAPYLEPIADLGVVLLLFAIGLKLDVRTLLLTLVSGLALLSAAKTVADAFVLYLSPHRKSYRLFITTDTPDFDPDTEAERLLLAKVLARKRRKQSLLVKHAIDPDGPSSAHLLHDAAVAAVADGGVVVG